MPVNYTPTTVIGPVAADSADGAGAFNVVANQAEANFNAINASFSAYASAYLSPAYTGSALVFLQSGWTMDAVSYGRIVGPFSYIYLSVTRTGAALTSSWPNNGTVDNGELCVVIPPGLRPTSQDLWFVGNYPCGWSGTLATNGVLTVKTSSQPGGVIATGAVLTASILINSGLAA